MMEAYLGPEPERALDFFAADVQFEASERPDGKVWHGLDGVRRAMIEWTGAWDEWEVDIDGYLEAGTDKVLVLWRERGRGKGSGVPMEQSGANLVTVRDHQITHVRLFLGRDRAIDAAGLTQHESCSSQDRPAS
jgi:ketosteroid isomerase-like protein